MSLGGQLDAIDVQVDKLQRLIQAASKHDPELGGGCATSESLGSVQVRLDKTAASCESLLSHLKDVLRSK